jgi:hypothetical protein
MSIVTLVSGLILGVERESDALVEREPYALEQRQEKCR